MDSPVQVGAAPGIETSRATAALEDALPQRADVADNGGIREAEDLIGQIEAGELESIGLLTWGEWRSFRDRSGTRPAGVGNISLAESALWRATMAGLFGEDWQAQLKARGSLTPDTRALAATAAATVAASASSLQLVASSDRPAEIADSLPGTVSAVVAAFGSGSATPAYTEGSWAPKTTEELSSLMRLTYDPLTTQLEAYEKQVVRCAQILRARGQEVDERLVRRLVLRAQINQEVHHLDEAERDAVLRVQFAESLEADDDNASGAEDLIHVLLEMTSTRPPAADADVAQRQSTARARAADIAEVLRHRHA